MMSPEEKMIYEIFGGRDTIIKNLMKQFDSDGDLLNSNGVAGMDVTGKGTSWQKLTNVSEEQDVYKRQNQTSSHRPSEPGTSVRLQLQNVQKEQPLFHLFSSLIR